MHHYSYLSSPTRLQCITEPYPEAQEGSTYNALQSSLISDGALTTSSGGHNQFTYHWSYTPQVHHLWISSITSYPKIIMTVFSHSLLAATR